MNKILQFKRNWGNASYYSTAEDFQRFFAAEMTDLLRLALLLTAEAENAERTLILAVRDCSQNDCVPKEWIRTRARRAVIRQAIHLVLDNETALPETLLKRQPQFQWSSGQCAAEAVSESLAILSLPKLERLVFVICGIERYSIQDCSLLLNESADIVRGALRCATSQLVDAEMPQGNGAADTDDASDVAG